MLGVQWLLCPSSKFTVQSPLLFPSLYRANADSPPCMYSDDCFDQDTVTTVDQLAKFTRLYEQCANQVR